MRGAAEAAEVAGVLDDEPPVDPVGQRRHGVPARGWRAPPGPTGRGDEQDHEHEQHEGGEEAPGPAHPEPGQVDGAGVVVLAEQQRRDRKPDSTKKRSTPRKPPGASVVPWKSSTAATATPRSPSSAGTWATGRAGRAQTMHPAVSQTGWRRPRSSPRTRDGGGAHRACCRPAFAWSIARSAPLSASAAEAARLSEW